MTSAGGYVCIVLALLTLFCAYRIARKRKGFRQAEYFVRVGNDFHPTFPKDRIAHQATGADSTAWGEVIEVPHHARRNSL